MIDDELYTWYYYFSWDAGVAELADAPDLGSGALRRGGSSPFSRTNFIAPFEVLFFLPKIKWLTGRRLISKQWVITLYVIIN